MHDVNPASDESETIKEAEEDLPKDFLRLVPADQTLHLPTNFTYRRQLARK